MKVRDIMTKDPVYCTPGTPLQEAARYMCDHDCGEVPVVDSLQGLRPVGAVTDRDITCRSVAQGRDPLRMNVGECMSSPCITVGLDASVDECCKTLETYRIRRAPVVDESGRLCGIVSQADIARKAGDRKAARVVKEISEPMNATKIG
jgi:CBS domain-containing protein